MKLGTVEPEVYWTPEIGHVFPGLTPKTMRELYIPQFFYILLSLEKRAKEAESS